MSWFRCSKSLFQFFTNTESFVNSDYLSTPTALLIASTFFYTWAKSDDWTKSVSFWAGAPYEGFSKLLGYLAARWGEDLALKDSGALPFARIVGYGRMSVTEFFSIISFSVVLELLDLYPSTPFLGFKDLPSWTIVPCLSGSGASLPASGSIVILSGVLAGTSDDPELVSPSVDVFAGLEEFAGLDAFAELFYLVEFAVWLDALADVDEFDDVVGSGACSLDVSFAEAVWLTELD